MLHGLPRTIACDCTRACRRRWRPTSHAPGQVYAVPSTAFVVCGASAFSEGGSADRPPLSRIRVHQLACDRASLLAKFADSGADEFAAASVLGSGHAPGRSPTCT